MVIGDTFDSLSSSTSTGMAMNEYEPIYWSIPPGLVAGIGKDTIFLDGLGSEPCDLRATCQCVLLIFLQYQMVKRIRQMREKVKFFSRLILDGHPEGQK